MPQNPTCQKIKNRRFLSGFYSVGIADEISNIKFIEDFDKIVNFMLSSIHV